MRQSKREIFDRELQYVSTERKHAPKGFLQPIYDLSGRKVRICSNTPAGKKGIECTVTSVSQEFSEKLGRLTLVLKFATGSSLTIPIPGKIEQSEAGDLYLSFERKNLKEDTSNPYKHLRKNVNGYTVNKEDGFPEVLITLLEKPQENV